MNNIVKECVEEMLEAAYKDGYEAEILDLSDAQLTRDLREHLEEFSYQEILAAVKEIRSVH